MATQRYQEIPEYAVLVQNAVKEIGIEIELQTMDSGTYYGDAVFGKSNWLDSVMGITDYGHRGVPNVYLSAPLRSDGSWNAAHFKNKEFDALAASYIAALDLEAQKADIELSIEDMRTACDGIEARLAEVRPDLLPRADDYHKVLKKGLGHIDPAEDHP